MQELFEKQDISTERYTVHSCMIENYKTTEKYDVIIAEGFLHGVDNQGVIVITCSDHICCFIELMKRLLGQIMVKDITVYDDKVNYLVSIFEPQLSKLKGVSRLAKDWVEDQILNPAFYNMNFSLSQAIDCFGDTYDVLGASPNMFTDYSWYKDVWYDYKDDYKRQFESKRMSLLMAGMPEKILPVEQVKDLTGCFNRINDLGLKYEKTMDEQYIMEIGHCMRNMRDKLSLLGMEFMEVYFEIEKALEEILETGMTDIEKWPHFFSAFGKTQQYIAFVKNKEK